MQCLEQALYLFILKTLYIGGIMLFESVAFAMGPTGGAGGQAGGLEMLGQFIPIIAVFALFWFLIFRPQQKRAKEHKEMLTNLKRGDYVISSGGMMGRILEIDDESILLECGESKLRITRGAIGALYEKGKPIADDKQSN